MECTRIDTKTLAATFDTGDTTIIHIEKGDVDKAIETIIREMDKIAHPRKHKMSLSDRFYYHQTYHSDIFYDALEDVNIVATIWD